jgi:ectoine hydroxylase-related dioxygenase (phytanoyl-CoA dioxygenase family)
MTAVASDKQAALDEVGYCVFPDFLDRATVARICDRVEQLYEEEGENAGSEFRQEPNTRRLANLIDKGAIFRELISTRDILAAVEHVLGPKFKLSSFNARSANANSDSNQPLHADMGGIADEQGYWVCNTVWMLDDFTEENGALRGVPGSHRWRKLPQDVLADVNERHPDEVLVTGTAGTVVVMNAHMWHGGTANRTSRPRRALHGFFCRWDKPQQQYQKVLLSAATQAALTPELRTLLAIDDPLNDHLSSGMERRSGFLK